MQPKTTKTRARNDRSGAVLIAVLVCLGIATSILLACMQMSLQQRRNIRRDWQMEQTEWLLDAGIRRAIARAGSDPDYTGETVSLSPAPPKCDSARLEIAIERDATKADAASLANSRTNESEPAPMEISVTAFLSVDGFPTKKSRQHWFTR